MTYRIQTPAAIREALAHFPPARKQEIKAAFRSLSSDPHSGEPLKWELEGRWKLRIGHYRIIYKIQLSDRTVRILAVGHRRDIYDRLK